MKKYRLLLITILLLVATALFADDVRFSIKQTEVDTPIANVTICWQLLHNNESKGFGFSDENGNAEFNIPIGKKAVVSISSIGYKSILDTLVIAQTNEFKLKQDIFNLSQVVVVGNSKPMPIDSSLYTVRVIDKQKIESTGAMNLADVLLTEPNVQITTDLILGTKVEMLGIGGSNVKIMIDGVPVIGRLSGQIDLSQITMDNVDHIEIIEGPTSVIYGNNALAGTINIITHKNKYFDTEATVSAAYEDVKKYDFSANVSQKVGKSIFRVSGDYSYFDGVDFDKSNRSMEWKPKEQYTANLGYLLQLKDWNLDAKISAYSNKLTFKSDIQNYRVYDSYYFTDRYNGSANLQGKWNANNHLNLLVAHSYYNRSSQEESKDLTTLKSIKGEKKSSQKERNNLLRAVWHHDFQTAFPLSVESGIDFNLSSMEGKRIKNGKQNLDDYATFVNVRYSPWSNFEIQPGVRYAYNTSYDAPLVYSLNAKWKITENISWRASAAKGFRAPTIKELYYIFVDSNHNIYGNSDLKSEKSYNYSTTLDYNFKWNKHHNAKLNLQLYYNDIENMISLIKQQDGTYKYDNINEYKTRGGSLGFTYYYKNWLRVNASSVLTARYNNLSSTSDSDDFTTSLDWITGVQVKEPYSKITLTTDFKYYGKENYFYYNTGGAISEGNREAYEMLNVSLSRKFWKNRVQLTVGAKNLTDITDAKLTGGATGGHTSSTSSSIAYGRTYFVRASFKIRK